MYDRSVTGTIAAKLQTGPVRRRAAIMIVDENGEHRALVEASLRGQFEIVDADSTAAALERLTDGPVDLVLMKIGGPGAKGLDAIRQMKGADSQRFLPVIVMNAENDQALLGQGLTAGADDFLMMPLAPALLEGKLRALLRASAAFDILWAQNKELGVRRASAERDYAIARRLLKRATDRSRLDLPDLLVYAQALEQFNGDFVLTAAVGPVLRLLVGDFAGHGLGAAVGALPVSEVFFSMAQRGFSLEALILELCGKLYHLLPRDLFLSTCILDVDLINHRLLVWNAGLPDALVFSADGEILHRATSVHAPAGILRADQVDTTLTEVPFPPGARLAIFSDGLIEARRADGEAFGQERVESAMANDQPFDLWVASLLHAHKTFCGRTRPDDDVTFVALGHTEALGAALREQPAAAEPAILPHTVLELRFGPGTLRSSDPLAPAHDFLSSSPRLTSRASDLRIVIGELFANAVDHGLLRLSSKVKEGPNGFGEYLRVRAERLAALDGGAIVLSLDVSGGGNEPTVTVTVTDTGRGFDEGALAPAAPDAKSGRGLRIVRELARAVRLRDGGRTVQAVVALGPEGPRGATAS